MPWSHSTDGRAWSSSVIRPAMQSFVFDFARGDGQCGSHAALKGLEKCYWVMWVGRVCMDYTVLWKVA